jgi:hypothetical protein
MQVMIFGFAIASRLINALKKSEKGLLNVYQRSFLTDRETNLKRSQNVKRPALQQALAFSIAGTSYSSPPSV